MLLFYQMQFQLRGEKSTVLQGRSVSNWEYNLALNVAGVVEVLLNLGRLLAVNV